MRKTLTLDFTKWTNAGSLGWAAMFFFEHLIKDIDPRSAWTKPTLNYPLMNYPDRQADPPKSGIFMRYPHANQPVLQQQKQQTPIKTNWRQHVSYVCSRWPRSRNRKSYRTHGNWPRSATCLHCPCRTCSTGESRLNIYFVYASFPLLAVKGTLKAS